ncbi:alpha/beta fold hydrolase [Pollutimonas harenae]|uniref:Alpha/beta hydrolase n=1 Tax=Pollutimonas harenae TaxID=657015 RepID=A0A853GYR7_9BURK|nr:alpha/beta fold hydrolase [Pollutimonas harenae]NYT85252.1 alpha/beta hydrolase [Pollutimonas harenae]TEA72379.1 alpha/beta hydrolase [Pollutimonas harenae]
MAKFVLVHGAFQGGWVYARVARKLREAGHDVYTPTLTGLGERAHLADRAINLDTHIQDIVNVFKYEDLTDAILCGHSYGGLVITGVAHEIGERIRTLFYLDAYAPADGQSLVDITGDETALAFVAQANQNGGMIPPIPAAIFNVNEADVVRVDTMSVSQPLATFVQGVKAGVDSTPVANRTYVFATRNGGDWFVKTHARLKSDSRWTVHEIPCGHSIMLDRPADLAALLLAEATK